MAEKYSAQEKDRGGDQPEVGQGFGNSEKESKPSKSKAPMSTNMAEHDEHLHKLMPAGYKGDCGY